MAEAEGPTAVVTVTADTSQATDQLNVMQSGFTRLESSALTTGRKVVSGIGGMMSAINNVYDAQQRLNVANINYTLTVREYGAGSLQAARALDQLQVAQNGVGLAQMRLNLQYLQFALTVGPSIYSTITKLMAAISGTTVANYVETASWYAKAAAIGLTVGLLTAGIGVMAGIASQAFVTQNVQQNNTYYGTAGTSALGMTNYASQNLSSAVSLQGGY